MRLRVSLLVVSAVVLVAAAASAGLLTAASEPPPALAAADTPVEHRAPVPATYEPRRVAPPVNTTRRSPPAPVPAPAAAFVPPISALPSVVARFVSASVEVWHAPTDDAPAFSLPSTTEWGNPRVLLATSLRGRWVRVSLPLRPNGSEGWVRARDVELSDIGDHIAVSLPTRTLTWSRAGQALLETTVGIGAANTPTPPGAFFVTDKLAADPAHGRGRWILALNGYSEALETYEGGLPRLAIHGTSNPGSIGRAMSAGCARVDAFHLAVLAAGVPVGTPVTIS